MKNLPAAKTSKTIEVHIPFDTLRELLVAHMYAISYLNDDQTVLDLKFKRGVDMKNMVTFDMTVSGMESESD
jgi:hypothetical protein